MRPYVPTLRHFAALRSFSFDQSPTRRRTPFTTSRGSIPDGKRFIQEILYHCSLFTPIAQSSPQNLLTCHLIYQIYHQSWKAITGELVEGVFEDSCRCSRIHVKTVRDSMSITMLITHNTPLARGCHDGSPFGSVTWTWSLVTILVTRLLVRFQFDGVTTGRKLRSTTVILTGYHHLHFIHLHEILTRVGFTKN